MKLLTAADIHMTTTNPLRRVDCYYDSILAKLDDIGLIVKEESYDVVLIAGDLFHLKSRVKWIEWSLIAEKIKSWKVPVYILPGNHDLFGANSESWKVQPVGALHEAGVATVVEGPITFHIGNQGKMMALDCVPFSYHNKLEDYGKESKATDPLTRQPVKADFVITLAHDMIFPEKVPFDCAYYLADEVMQHYKGDILINGHVHNYNYMKQYDKRTFLQLGSIARGVLKIDDKDRPVSVWGIEVKDDMQYTLKEHILKSVKPFDEVFDVNAYMVEKEYESNFKDFTEGITKEVSLIEQHDVQPLVRGMGEFASLSDPVRQVVEEFLNKVDV